MESGGICDGCAQAQSECLCDVDLTEVLDCNSPFHPGCRKCEQPPEPPPARVRKPHVEDHVEVHGATCGKVPHEAEGYLHGADDDSPYDVDGVVYCGRCHEAMTS